jgi:hypothetical protein
MVACVSMVCLLLRKGLNEACCIPYIAVCVGG